MAEEPVGLLFKEAGNLVTKDMQNLKLLNTALIWSLPVGFALRPPRSLSLVSKPVEVRYCPCVCVPAIEGIQSSWHLVTSGISHGSVPGPILFNNFINILKNGLEFAFGKFPTTELQGGRGGSSQCRVGKMLCRVSLTDWS